jgi:NAD(P)-dependent dehydrogenase (short-subunit alcohol dehydrogenase family)
MLAQSSGKVINIASVLTFQGGVPVPSYAAAKGAVGQLTKAFANEWAAKGVNANAIAPWLHGYGRGRRSCVSHRSRATLCMAMCWPSMVAG